MPVQRKDAVSKWFKIPLCYPAGLFNSPSFARRIIEIGPGRGDFLYHLAEKNKDAVVIAIELKSGRYFKLIERINKRKLVNVMLIQADGRYAITRYFEKGAIDEIHINFPDPWPKNKHGKNRLISKQFLKDCAEMLAKDGTLNIVTDSEAYSNSIKKDAAAIKDILKDENTSGEVFPTYFAEKWKKMGRSFFFFKWKK